VLIWFQGWPCHLPHAIALALKERYGIKDFSALVLGYKQKNFLETQRDIKYDPIVVVQDIFLKSMELKIDYKYLSTLEKYGSPSLWMCPLADRDLLMYNNYKFYTHEEHMKIIQGYFKYTREMLEKVKPDFIIMVPAESMELLVLHNLAKDMHIPTLMISSTRTGDRYTVHKNTYQQFERIFEIYDRIEKENYKSPHKKAAVRYIQEFRRRHVTFAEYKATYKGQQEFFESILKHPIKNLKRALDYFYNYYFGYYKNDYMYKNKSPLKLILRELKIRFKRTFKKSKIFESPDYREPYVYFPLHFEPEIALSLLAPFYMDQAALVENIAKSLPIHFKLYVKEHPMMIGFRPKSFYQRLRKMPNVRLIDPFTSSYELSKNAKIVAVITGSAGWEALLLKKPVITFGHVFFNKLKMVKKVRDITSLHEVISDILRNYRHDEKQLVNFVTAIYEGSFSMDPLEISKGLPEVLSTPSFNNLVTALAKEMGLEKS